MAGIGIPGQALAATAGSPATKPPGPTCHQVSFIGARGSGQANQLASKFEGFGPEVYEAVTVIQGDLNAKKITWDLAPINYTAASTSVLKPSMLDFMDWSDYLKTTWTRSWRA